MKFVVLLFVFALSCSESNLNRSDCIRPYTKKEKLFIFDLQEQGMKVKLFRFNYPYMLYDEFGDELCQGFETATYRIEIENISSTSLQNVDSVRTKSKEIASYFYRSIIEDSILFYTEDFTITFRSQTQEKKLSEESEIESYSFFDVEFRKKELEDFCEFEVIESKGKLIRKKVTKQSEELVIWKEYIGK